MHSLVRYRIPKALYSLPTLAGRAADPLRLHPCNRCSDKELRFKAHLADKAGKATKVALALRRLKGLQSKSVKQLAKSSVLPVADYASPIWYPLAT